MSDSFDQSGPRKKVTCFEDLFIWQKVVEFAKEIYLLTERKSLRTDFGLRGQMRDAAVAISTKTAEDFERRFKPASISNHMNAIRDAD